MYPEEEYPMEVNEISIEKPKKNKVGRPKIEANWDRIKKEVNIHQVLYWIGIQATAQEIAGAFRISPDTLDLRLKEEFGCNFTDLKKRLGNGADGKLSLRRNQFKMSETNPTMAIWLGKQYLGQKDHDGLEGLQIEKAKLLLEGINKYNAIIENERSKKSSDEPQAVDSLQGSDS